MSLKRFYVVGEYGPQADACVHKSYLASSPENARQMFEIFMQREFPYTWTKMGSKNVTVFEEWKGHKCF